MLISARYWAYIFAAQNIWHFCGAFGLFQRRGNRESSAFAEENESHPAPPVDESKNGHCFAGGRPPAKPVAFSASSCDPLSVPPFAFLQPQAAVVLPAELARRHPDAPAERPGEKILLPETRRPGDVGD